MMQLTTARLRQIIKEEIQKAHMDGQWEEKEEYDIEGKSEEEKLLYEMLNKFKLKLKKKCKKHFGLEDK